MIRQTFHNTPCFRFSLRVVLLIAIAFAASNLAAQPAKKSVAKLWSAQWQPATVVNGSPVVFRVTPPARLDSLTGKWLGHELSFFFDPKSKNWYALAGTSLETSAGSDILALTGTTAGGKEISFQRTVTVRKARYPVIAVTVAKQFTEPSAEQLKTINQDKAVKQDIFRSVDPNREWSGKFRAPVVARTSDVFGTRRTFNGQTRSTHEGLDYAVPTGTAVAALNSGIVLLARPLYFEGNCVVLDHGQGLLTLYLHLSEFKVKEGDHVAGGQVVGLSGGTGRATGPHLHIAVRWQGIYLDPAILLKLSLP